ncbi:MAG: putative selenate ABC transporter substrate-binding protein, partial [Cyanobacteria bacterium J083]
MFKKILSLVFISCAALSLNACQGDKPNNSKPKNSEVKTFAIGAIPDQDPEKLQRLYTKLAQYLEKKLGVPVEYKPVTDYTAAVTAFRVGDLDLVWFGGLTGVQARLQVPEAQAIAQRDIDAEFHSVFIANTKSQIKPIQDLKQLQLLKGSRLIFGSESSTSGRLMPQYYLQQAGVKLEDFANVGFSGSHDKTIKLVESGSYDIGAVNEQVWQTRLAAKEVDLDRVKVIWRTPAYYDYHWVINSAVKERYGADFITRVQTALL